MNALYTDNDPKCCQWLENLVAAGQLPPGRIVCRDIREFKPADFDGYKQVHHFCGIGGWPYALKLAGWPEDEEVWTASCPCQPFSCAGKGMGESDERHLWPFVRNLIGHRKPAIVFGEQVGSPLGRKWISGVRADLAQLGYSFGASDLCAAGVQAPHIRQRLFWVAYAAGLPRSSQQRGEPRQELGRQAGQKDTAEHRTACGLAVTQYPERRPIHVNGKNGRNGQDWRGDFSGMGNTDNAGSQRRNGGGLYECSDQQTSGPGGSSFWADAIWHECRDGKARRISPKSSLFPLAPRLPGRVGVLRGAGNSIVPQVAAQFIQSAREALNIL